MWHNPHSATFATRVSALANTLSAWALILLKGELPFPDNRAWAVWLKLFCVTLSPLGSVIASPSRNR